MRHDPASAAVVIMLKSLKMHGMAQAVSELTEQGSPAFEAAIPILSQLLKAETAEREVRSVAYQLKAGATYRLNDTFELYGEYAYRATEDIETNNDLFPGTLEIENQQNIFSVGARYRFG